MALLNRVRILIADDDPLVRAGLRMIMDGGTGIDVIGEAADGYEAADVAGRLAPDIVLMDLRMPRLDGLGAIRRLRERGSTARVLVLTTFDTDELILAALRAGAAGFLLKDTSPPDLVRAVHQVAAGQPILSPTVTGRLIAAVTEPEGDARRRTAQALLARLTDRERAVALAISEGLSNTEIAVALHLGVATVKTHVGSVFAKLGATNRVKVARFVRDAALEQQS